MQLFLVLATAGVVTAAVPGLWEQKPFQNQGGDAKSAITSDGLRFATGELEEYIEDVMERWHAPGAAVAIIKGGNIWTKVNFQDRNKLLITSWIAPELNETQSRNANLNSGLWPCVT